MANNTRQRSFAGWITALFLTELAIVFLVVPHGWVSKIGGYDRAFVLQWFGPAFEEKVLNDAMQWFDTVFVKTNIQDSTYRFLVGQWNASGDIPLDDRGLGALTVDRLNTAWAAVSVAFYRFSETLKWAVVVLPLMVGALLDGLTQREINKWRYFMPSPMLQHGVRLFILSVVGLALILPFAPIPMYAPLLPLLVCLTAVFLWAGAANLSKRL